MSNARQLIDLLSEESNLVDRIVREVENYLGDVIDVDMDDDTARENCWTLCIDKANDLTGRGPRAISAAREACAVLGYPPKGYRPRKPRPVPDKPQVRREPEPPMKPPTGVVHPPYRPDVPLLRREG